MEVQLKQTLYISAGGFGWLYYGHMYESYIFSGHESFPCKTLWLTKGYDFVNGKGNFNAPDAVMALGVGKNMVSSIRYWLKAFGLCEQDGPTDNARYLFDESNGADRYIESLGTLWLLHYLLVSGKEATLYNITFVLFQRERKTFEREQLVSFVGRIMAEDGKGKAFNANTVKKDVSVLLQNYTQPYRAKSSEDYSTLLIDLDLLRVEDGGKSYAFNIEGKRKVPMEIFLYAVLNEKAKLKDKSVPYDTLQEIGLMFCMTDAEVIDMAQAIGEKYPEHVQYSDNAGIRQLLFREGSSLERADVLDKYYKNATV